MNKLALAVRSRTFWTVVLLVAMNTIPQLKGLVSQQVLDGINTVLGLLAAYFHVNPSQNYQNKV
jgi:hypothetical protein